MPTNSNPYSRNRGDRQQPGAITLGKRGRVGRAEAQALKPSAGIPPFQAVRELVRRVQSDCAVEIDGNAYSVPWRLIGEMVRATKDQKQQRADLVTRLNGAAEAVRA